MTPERLAKIQQTTENTPALVSRDGWDEVFGPSFDAEGKPDGWGCGIVAVSQHYDRPEALGMFLAEAKPTILELCNEIAVLRASEGMHAEEYEKRCEALHDAVRQRDDARAQLRERELLSSIPETDLSVEYTVTGKVTDLKVVHLPSGNVALRTNIRSRIRAMQEVLSELEWRLQQDAS